MSTHDNRIPEAVRRKSAGSTTPESDWLLYEDWIPVQPASAGRVVVAVAERQNGDDSPFTLSCLIRDDPESRATVLASADWDLDQDDMLRAAIDRGFGDEPRPNAIDAVPLTINRSYLDRKGELDIVQAFVLHHAGYHEGNEIRFVDLDGNRHTLAWFVAAGGIERIELDEHLLRTFLRDRGVVLVRFHDHRRFDQSRGGPEERIERECVSGSANYRVIRVTEEGRGMGLLRGKDIITPYAAAKSEPATEDHVAFIIGMGDGEEPIEVSCDPAKLSNLFTDRGTVNYLTDVFFRADVLDRYYESADFTIEHNTVTRNGIWSIPFAATDDGLIHVQLGDLSRIPIEHQYHWRAHNIVSYGGIPSDRYRRDFLAEWTETSDPIALFKAALVRLQEATRARYGEPVIHELQGGDEHFLDALRVPANDDWRAFDTQLLNITKPTSDSINVKLLRHLLPFSGSGEDKRPPIALFEEWLKSLGIADADANASAVSLRSAQTLRSESSAHRKGSDLEKTIRKLGFEGIARSRIILGLVVGIRQALERGAV